MRAPGSSKPLWGGLFFVSVFLIIVANTALLGPDCWLVWAYPVTALLMIIAMIALGFTLSGRAEGLIIDNRNCMSLSKLQMLIWTVVVVSALTAAAAYNIRNGLSPHLPGGGQTGPLEIVIPNELLFAMGIAATSFVAAPTVLSLKANETPTNADVQAAAASSPGQTLNHNGKVYGRVSSSDAQWSDIFMGDEVGNGDSPDLSKIQQFAITLLLVGIYSAQLVQMFGVLHVPGSKAFTFFDAMPKLGDQFVVLMGISHASYLVYKAAPHTADGDSSASAAGPAANAVG
jgi:hypothetical protein